MAGWGGGPNSRWAALPRLEANPTLRPDHPGTQAPNRRRCTKDPCVCAWRQGQTLLHEISYDYSGAVSLGDQIRGGGTSARVGGMARLRLPTWHSGRLVCRDEATGTSDRNCFAPARIRSGTGWHCCACQPSQDCCGVKLLSPAVRSNSRLWPGLRRVGS